MLTRDLGFPFPVSQACLVVHPIVDVNWFANPGAGRSRRLIWGLMMIRRLSLILVLVAALASCSTGSSNEASTTSATKSPGAATTSTEDSAGGGATDFCTAFKEADDSKGATTAAAFGTGLLASAADMRNYAPPEIKDVVETYADVLDNIGKAAQSGTLDEAALKKALASGLADKAADTGKVALWITRNCHF